MKCKILSLAIIIFLCVSLVNIPIAKSEELLETLTPPWGNYKTCDHEYTSIPGTQNIFIDTGSESGDQKKETILVNAIAGLQCGVEITQKCWHEIDWVVPHEDNYRFEFDYTTSGYVELSGATIPLWPPTGVNTGWCSITVFIKIYDPELDAYWLDYWRCVAAKSDIIAPIQQNFEEEVNYQTRSMHMTEGRQLEISFGLTVKTVIAAYGIAAETCNAYITGQMNQIDIYSDFNPDNPILCVDPDPLIHDFGAQSKGARAWYFNVYNGGGGSLDYSVKESCNWMLISPRVTQSPQDWNNYLVIDTTDLSYGNHEATFTVESDYGTKTGTIRVNVVNGAPYPPCNPYPQDERQDALTTILLNWNCEDVDNDPITYDVYFGTDSSPDSSELIKQNYNYNYTVVGHVDQGKTYYWKVVAKDDQGHSTEGPVWSFKTNSVPNKPSPPSGPASGSFGQSYTYSAVPI